MTQTELDKAKALLEQEEKRQAYLRDYNSDYRRKRRDAINAALSILPSSKMTEAEARAILAREEQSRKNMSEAQRRRREKVKRARALLGNAEDSK